MIYLIDGYNLLFKLFHNEKKLENQREVVINFLYEKASILNLKFTLVFDGYKQNQKFSNISYYDNLKVIYTPKKQTADDYILEQIFLSEIPSQILVVTSDNLLKFKAKDMQAQTKSIESFIDWLSKKELKKKKALVEEENFVDTKKNIERLLKIFEDNIKKEKDNWF